MRGGEVEPTIPIRIDLDRTICKTLNRPVTIDAGDSALLGKGGNGYVLSGTIDGDNTASRYVAVKVVKYDQSVNVEITILKHITDNKVPNVTHLMEVLINPSGRPNECYIVMEGPGANPDDSKVKQLELFQVAKNTVTSPPIAIDYIVQMLEALQRLHKIGVYHRDLKLDNMLATFPTVGRKTITIIDFGMGNTNVASPGQLTFSSNKPNNWVGSIRQISPEIVKEIWSSKSGNDVTVMAEPVEVFSIGVILYSLLQGAAPHQWRPVHPGAVNFKDVIKNQEEWSPLEKWSEVYTFNEDRWTPFTKQLFEFLTHSNPVQRWEVDDALKAIQEYSRRDDANCLQEYGRLADEERLLVEEQKRLQEEKAAIVKKELDESNTFLKNSNKPWAKLSDNEQQLIIRALPDVKNPEERYDLLLKLKLGEAGVRLFKLKVKGRPLEELAGLTSKDATAFKLHNIITEEDWQRWTGVQLQPEPE